MLRTEDQAVKSLIDDLYTKAQELAQESSTPHPPSVLQMLKALVALLKDLHDDPEIVSASIRRTILQAADFISAAYNNPVTSGEKDTAAFKLLAVDDEIIALKLVSGALENVQLNPETSGNPASALELLSETRFDLFILDVNMPGMTGFELCQRIRRLPFYSKTPVIFVTSARDFKSRLQFAKSGGDDFIAKPFLGTELATKALLHLLSR